MKEEILIRLALDKGWINSDQMERLKLEISDTGGESPGCESDWLIIPLLLQKGELTLAQINELDRKARQHDVPQPESEAKKKKAAETVDLLPIAGERYRIEELLGSGGMGEVWRAFDHKLNRFVALKKLRADSPELLARFLREAHTQARIEHENICKIYDIGEKDGRWHIAMQYIPGKTLKVMADELNQGEKVLLVVLVAEAVHEAHRLGVIHRDLKPANIMIETGSDGRRKPYVLDFGLVRDLNQAEGTITENVLGTPCYMSPEQVRGDRQKIDRRTDVYSLGVTLYELLAGDPPFKGDNAADVWVQVLQVDPQPLRQRNNAVPFDLETIVMKCLEKDPDRRYGSARELAADLRCFLNGRPVLARRYTPAQRLMKWVRRHKPMAMVLAVASLALLVVIGLWVQAVHQSRLRSEAAERFGRDGEAMASIMRYAYLVPPHDIRPDRRKVEAQLGEVRARMKALGRAAAGPGNYALGQGYLALRNWLSARRHLEVGWQNGFRTPEAAYALGVVMGELYRMELAKTGRIPIKEARELEKKRLQREYAQPALRMLAAAQSTRDIPANYVRALIAFYEKKYDLTLQILATMKDTDKRFYEVNLLKGDIGQAQADELWRAGQTAAASQKYELADRAFQAAAATGRSDPQVYLRLSALCQRKAFAETLTGNKQLPDSLAPAIALCKQALDIDADASEAYIERASIFNTLALQASYYQAQDPSMWVDQGILNVEKAIILQPENAYAHYIAGKLMQTKSFHEKDHGRDPNQAFRASISYFHKALDLYPGFVSAQLELAWTQMVFAEFQYWHGIDATENIAAVIQSAGGLRARHADFTEAQTLLGNALYFKFVIDMSRGKEEKQELERAIQCYDKVIAINPHVFSYYMVCGILFLQMAQWRLEYGMKIEAEMGEAVAMEKAALAINPQDANAFINLGCVSGLKAYSRLLQGQYAQDDLRLVRTNLQKAQELHSQYYEIFPPLLLIDFIEAQRAYWQQQAPDRFLASARNIFRKAIVVNPDYFEIYNRFASILFIQAKYLLMRKMAANAIIDEGRNILNKSIAIKADSFYSHRLLGEFAILQARAAMGKKQDPASLFLQAQLEIERALLLNPRSAGNHVAQAEFCLWNSRWQLTQNRPAFTILAAGLQAVDRALAINPESAEAFLIKSLLLHTRMMSQPYQEEKNRDYLKQVQAMRHAKRINPSIHY
jgi:eukaryotic-like serine/threonine-protein kinase